MKKINYLDLFSGIGGFTLGLQQAGVIFNKHYFSEIDKYATKIYKQLRININNNRTICSRCASQDPNIFQKSFIDPSLDDRLATGFFMMKGTGNGNIEVEHD